MLSTQLIKPKKGSIEAPDNVKHHFLVKQFVLPLIATRLRQMFMDKNQFDFTHQDTKTTNLINKP